MLRIIELEIEEALTGNTRVEEVAWVEMPAIEQELMFFGRQKFYKAPEYVSEVACRAIRENEKRGNPAGTQVGKVRAQQLCNRSEISLETIKRMKSYLERAATYNSGDWDDNGTISYGLWGGEEALTWVDKILRSVENEDFEEGVPHYTKDGVLYEGPTHKHNGRLMTGAVHTEDSEYLYHEGEFAEVGPRGGIKESDKAPKSDTPNRNPKGEGTAKGDASTSRGAEVTERVEEILKNKSDEFNEKYKDKLGYGVNVGMLKSVYQRGVGAYNTSHSPAVKSSEQWALARVNAFLYLVKNGRPENSKYDSDFDLLPSGHPKKEKMSEEFVKPSAGETKDEFIARCIPYLIREGKTQDAAAGACYGMWEQKFAIYDRVSFDWDETLTDPRSIKLLENERRKGSLVYIISARSTPSNEMLRFASKWDIPSHRIFTVGSNKRKVEKIQELGIARHYDNNPSVINELGGLPVGIQFDYVIGLPSYQVTSGDTMLVKPVLMEEDCGCSQQQNFELLGYINGEPVFSNKEDAIAYGESKGCNGYHEMVDQVGNTVYMGCEIHQEFSTDFSEYSEEEKEAWDTLMELKTIDKQKFEAVLSGLNGATKDEVERRNHANPTNYFRYDIKVTAGPPDRSFCSSIEGRYFRRMEIDLLRDSNRDFGHNGQPYSKWLYKGGPICKHAWRKFLVQGRNFADLGWAEGKAGEAPRELPGKGFYPGTPRYEANLSKQDFDLTGELEPIMWADDYPVYNDPVIASDVSYLIGCGGIYEEVMMEGNKMFKSCSSNMKKEEMSKKQLFASDEEKRMIYTPLMIPNILIPRMDETTGERYFVRFRPETIEKISQKFLMELRNKHTNYEHSDKKFQDVVMVESWIVSGDKDKAYELGFTKEQIPHGTWFAGYRVLDTPEGDEVWDLIKSGKVKGASVEGEFLLKFSRQKTDEYLLEQIINILNKID